MSNFWEKLSTERWTGRQAQTDKGETTGTPAKRGGLKR